MFYALCLCPLEKVPFATFYPPPRLSEKSRREQKSLYPTTGATTDSQSSLGELLLLRQSPPLEVPVWHIFFQKKTFSSGLMFYALCFMFYDYQWCANFRIYVRNLLTLQSLTIFYYNLDLKLVCTEGLWQPLNYSFEIRIFQNLL